jgi:hypothetical protein
MLGRSMNNEMESMKKYAFIAFVERLPHQDFWCPDRDLNPGLPRAEK